MIKYKDYYIVFEEIPDMVTLALNITNCRNRCVGCHSPELRDDIGIELTEKELNRIISENDGINCVCFMGEGNDAESLQNLILHVKRLYPDLKVGLYSGRKNVSEDFYWNNLDYLKVGPYIEEFGPLNSTTTNQKLYNIIHCGHFDQIIDITGKFWKIK